MFVTDKLFFSKTDRNSEIGKSRLGTELHVIKYQV